MVRVNWDLPVDVHRALKVRSVQLGVKFRDFAVSVLSDYLRNTGGVRGGLEEDSLRAVPARAYRGLRGDRGGKVKKKEA